MGVKRICPRAAGLPSGEVSSLVVHPGPVRPVQQVTCYRPGPAGSVETWIARRFLTAELGPDGCGRCDECTAQHGTDGRSMCLVRLAGRVESG